MLSYLLLLGCGVLIAGAYVFADWLRWRKVDAYMRDHPTGVVANLTPPTVAELGSFEWAHDTSDRWLQL